MTELRVQNVSLSLDGCAAGEDRLFDGRGEALAGWRCVEFALSETVTHVRLRR